jgi:parallel beta-helix repeat protein
MMTVPSTKQIWSIASLGLTALLLSSCAPAAIEVAAGADAQGRLQAALIAAKPGQTIKLGEGKFDLVDGLSLDVANVKLIGAGPDKTILSFKQQTGAGEGLMVTSDGVTLEGFAVEDTKGDGIKSKGADNITYRNLRVEWTRGPNTDNGAYGIYPVESTNVLIDKIVVRGSSDAGIYVGQSRNIIVRNSLAEQNVAGIEIENSINADVHDNVARKNTAGILVFDLPGLPQVGGGNVRIANNKSIDNDLPNFGKPGAIVSSVPKGVGLIVMANKGVWVDGNEFAGNGTAHVLVVAYQYKDIGDERYNPLPRDISINQNKFGPGGTTPDGPLAPLAPAVGGKLPDVLWDGATRWMLKAVGGNSEKSDVVKIQMRNDGPTSFLNLNVPLVGADLRTAKPSMDLPRGDGAALPTFVPIKLPQDTAPTGN